MKVESEDRWLKEGDSADLKLSVVLPAFYTSIRSEVELKNLQTGEKESKALLCEENGTLFRFDGLKAGTQSLAFPALVLVEADAVECCVAID